MATPEKNRISDIKPGVPRSIRDLDIRPVSQPAKVSKPAPIVLPKEVPFVPTPPKSSSKHGLWFLAVLCIAGLVFALSYLFESANVTIIPKTVPIAFDATDMFTATKDSTDPTALSYTVMSIEGDTTITLDATETKPDGQPATGMVTIYNAYSTGQLKIPAATQIKATNGQMYTLDTAVVVPGYKKTATTTNPGMVDVSVTAATSGEEGNQTTADFTIPSFSKKGQAGKIYAKAKTPLAGGVSGVLNTVPRSASDAAYQSLKDQLHDSLIKKTRVQVPPGYLFYEGATVFTTDDAATIPYSKDTKIPIALHGKLTTYLIKEDSLVQNIVSKFVTDYNNEPVTIPKISSLTFVPPANQVLEPDTDTTITFNFQGSASILWTIDRDQITGLLAGAPKSSFQEILARIPGIEKADLVIKPFWKQSFPEDSKKITVEVDSPLP